MHYQTNDGAIIQTIIAFIALLFGYPLAGNLFIILMTPLVIYMVVKQDSKFLPALMLHCASETSIYFLIFFAIIIFCLSKSSIILRNKHLRFIYWGLLLTLPLYLILTWQKLFIDGLTWQIALSYSTYYLSFWGMLYCYLIANSFNQFSLRLLLFSIVSLLIIHLSFSHISGSVNRLGSTAAFCGVSYGLYLLWERRFIGIIVGGVSFILVLGPMTTFTELITIFYSIIVLILWKSYRNNTAQKSIGWFSYVIVLLLMMYGISNFQTIQIQSYSDTMDFSSWQSFWNRAQFKFFGDRAIFWDSAWNQLILYKPVFPIHDIPNIQVYSLKGTYIDNVQFGAHNSPLQLLRIFGFLMGGILIVCYIMITTLASNCLSREYYDKQDIPLFLIAICNSIVLFLTGTAAMLPGFALFSFGLCGIAYGKYTEMMKK